MRCENLRPDVNHYHLVRATRSVQDSEEISPRTKASTGGATVLNEVDATVSITIKDRPRDQHLFNGEGLWEFALPPWEGCHGSRVFREVRAGRVIAINISVDSTIPFIRRERVDPGEVFLLGQGTQQRQRMRQCSAKRKQTLPI